MINNDTVKKVIAVYQQIIQLQDLMGGLHDESKDSVRQAISCCFRAIHVLTDFDDTGSPSEPAQKHEVYDAVASMEDVARRMRALDRRMDTQLRAHLFAYADDLSETIDIIRNHKPDCLP